MTLANIYQVRVPDEANAIINNVDGKKVVIVGTSFIGMEAASCIAKKAASVIAIGMEKVPFERVLGLQIGSALQKVQYGVLKGVNTTLVARKEWCSI